MGQIDVQNRTRLAFYLDASVHNIPISFDHTNPGSLWVTGISYAEHLQVTNFSTQRIVLNYTSGDPNNNPSDNNIQMFSFGKGSADFVGITRDDLQIAQCVYIRSHTGTPVTSGLIFIEVW